MSTYERLKRVDAKGMVHYAKRATSVFSACSTQAPIVADYTVALLYPGDMPPETVVTCIMCMVLHE